MSVDPYEGTVVGRDPITKTLVAQMLAKHPDDTNEQISDRIVRAFRSLAGPDADVPMTPEIVARWRPEVTR